MTRDPGVFVLPPGYLFCAGQRWELTCPFFLDTVSGWSDDPETWRPGRDGGPDRYGKEVREVVAVVDLPKPYQRRVFYKRSWVAPDGHQFGNGRLLSVSLPAFRRWVNNGPDWNRQFNGATLCQD